MQKLNGTTIALIAALVLLVGAIAYFATSRNPDQDKLTNSQVAIGTAPSESKACGNKATYDLIKRELFRRAAQLRGSDQAAYDRLANYAVIRMENPVMESEDSSTHAVNCSGSLALDLPPGVAVVGGRRTLGADLDYTVQQATDGTGNVVLIRNADAIVTPLATLIRVSQPEVVQPGENGVAAEGIAPTPSAATPQPNPAAPTTSSAPSVGCANARSSGERAVCGDSGLASLDQNMSSQYQRAFAEAGPAERELLRQTAGRFYAYRDRCPDRKCMADAYVGRMREIRDIMDGRWQPVR